jgi:hypothetical protein
VIVQHYNSCRSTGKSGADGFKICAVDLFETSCESCRKRWPVPITICSVPAGNQDLSYVGCFPEPTCGSEWSRAMQLLSKSDSLTVEGCLELAAAANYKYAAVQYAFECFGGNDISQYIGRGTCNKPCTGNASQMCGGGCTNAIYRAGGPAQLAGECNVIGYVLVSTTATHRCVPGWFWVLV